MSPGAASRQAKAESTRDRIQAGARALFVRQGFEATTIRQVAKEAQVSVGSVHSHFGDKHGLLQACLFDTLKTAIEGLWSSLPEDAPLKEQLLHCANHLYLGYAKHPALSRAMLRGSLFPKKLEEDPFFMPFLTRVAKLFDRAVSRGEVALRDGDALPCAQVFFALYFSTLLGGLSGAFGTKRSAPARATLWCGALAPLIDAFLFSKSMHKEHRGA